MPAQFISLVPPIVAALHQEGLLERAFHDPLVENLQFRADAQREEADAQIGTSIFMTRRGLLPINATPRRANEGDPQPQALAYEQWISTLDRYYDTIDTSLIRARTQLADELGSDLHALGVQAGRSINYLARNKLYKPYAGGHTVLIAATAAPDTTIRVAALNGFRFVVLRGTNVAPQPVSVALPLPITIGPTAIARFVIGAVPDDPNDPDGPGTLTLSAAVGAIVAIRSAVLAGNRPRIVRAGGGTTVDAIGASDIVVLQDFNAAVTILRNNKVPPHEDGLYHCHFPPDANLQIFADEVFQRLHTALPDGDRYQSGFVNQILGVKFIPNTECPNFDNSGATVATGTNARYSTMIGAETVNEGGTRIGRCIVTGRGAQYERWFDAKKHLSSEAGMTGKQGDFAVVNNGIQIDTDGIRLIIRSPIDRLQDIVSSTWDYIGDFPVPSDIAAGGPEHYKRAVEVEFALP
jgi:hypothetical protein